MPRVHCIIFLSLCLILVGVRFTVATTLFGGVQHSEYEAPASRYNPTFGTQLQNLQSTTSSTFVPMAQTPESGMNDTIPPDPTFQAQAPQRRVDWFRIPAWMAGRWIKKGDMTLNVTDLKTGRSSNVQQWTDDELTITWGHQVDRAGNIWEANIVPSERDGLTNAMSVRFLLVDCRCEQTSPEQVITRMHYIVTESAGWGQTVDQFQQESINDYTPISYTELQNYSSTRVFTYDGAPTRNGILLSKFTRVAAFQPIASQDGIDLRQSLGDFLRSHQMQDLIPDQGPPGSYIPTIPQP